MVGKKQLVLWLNEKIQNNYLKEKKKHELHWLVGYLLENNIMHIVSKLVFSLNIKQKILTIQKVIRICDTNIVIIQHCETHLNKNQEWYVKEIDYQNLNKESKNSFGIVSNNQQWNWILDSLHTSILQINWALAKYRNLGGKKLRWRERTYRQNI